jgi:hypothetical protein
MKRDRRYQVQQMIPHLPQDAPVRARDADLLSDPGDGEGAGSGLDGGIQGGPSHAEGLGRLGDGKQQWARTPLHHETTWLLRPCESAASTATPPHIASLLSERSR